MKNLLLMLAFLFIGSTIYSNNIQDNEVSNLELNLNEDFDFSNSHSDVFDSFLRVNCDNSGRSTFRNYFQDGHGGLAFEESLELTRKVYEVCIGSENGYGQGWAKLEEELTNDYGQK